MKKLFVIICALILSNCGKTPETVGDNPNLDAKLLAEFKSHLIGVWRGSCEDNGTQKTRTTWEFGEKNSLSLQITTLNYCGGYAVSNRIKQGSYQVQSLESNKDGRIYFKLSGAHYEGDLVEFTANNTLVDRGITKMSPVQLVYWYQGRPLSLSPNEISEHGPIVISKNRARN